MDSNSSNSSTAKPATLVQWLPILLPLGWLWFHLINNLRLEWSTNPQYSYGLVVPILVVGMLFRRWMNSARRVAIQPASGRGPLIVCVVLAAMLLPARLVEEATPEWRPLQWLLAIEIIGITLYAIYIAAGREWLRQARFPILFFLVALPWPSLFETPIIQGLSRLNAQLVVEVLSALGMPALQHGNLIEVGSGIVGVNDACSGIRSLQSSLMISLFLGEFFMLGTWRRILLVPMSFALAMLLNLCRASILAWVAAKDGVNAIAKYHDEAGMTILLVCTAALWLAGWLMSRGNATEPEKTHEPTRSGALDLKPVRRFGYALIIWCACIEVGVALWYHLREANIKPSTNWSVALPTNNPTFKAIQPTDDEKILLRFDNALEGEWSEADGSQWKAFYFDWKPGRVAGYLAKRHTPDICLTATGLTLAAGPTLEIIKVNGIDLPMRHYVFETPFGRLQVYQCHWEAGLSQESYTADESGRLNLIRGIWAGRGNQGQKVLEIVLGGYPDEADARKALGEQLEKMIVVEK